MSKFRMSKIESITIDFKILSYLCYFKDNANLVSKSSMEISKDLKLSRAIVDTALKSLKDSGYLVYDETCVDCYYLTDEVVKLVSMFRKKSK